MNATPCISHISLSHTTKAGVWILQLNPGSHKHTHTYTYTESLVHQSHACTIQSKDIEILVLAWQSTTTNNNNSHSNSSSFPATPAQCLHKYAACMRAAYMGYSTGWLQPVHLWGVLTSPTKLQQGIVLCVLPVEKTKCCLVPDISFLSSRPSKNRWLPVSSKKIKTQKGLKYEHFL